MFDPEKFKSELYATNIQNFEIKSLELFKYQFDNNQIYNKYCSLLGLTPNNVKKLTQIPFLPIEFYKSEKVTSGIWEPVNFFKSSGTTTSERSINYIKDLNFYLNVSLQIFETFYGNISQYEILALLPSYQEQNNSSLICMVDYFISKASPNSAYYLNENESLIKNLESSKSKKILLGVSYALLDLAETKKIECENLIVIETGGMKGRRHEITRKELHEEIKSGINVSEVHSEYGMCELSSQAYGTDGEFRFPNWATVIIRDTNDPFTYLGTNKSGGINIIDLANVHTCAFIETKDLGKCSSDGTFEILGRFDNTDIRGCNLLI